VTETRTRIDWAIQMKNLVDVYYPEAEKIRVIMDHLDTHTYGSLYEAFRPKRHDGLQRSNLLDAEAQQLGERCRD